MPEQVPRRPARNSGSTLSLSRAPLDALARGLPWQRQELPDDSDTTKAIDYSLNRWAALARHLDDGDLPADNHRVENQIRPIEPRRNKLLVRRQSAGGRQARCHGKECVALGPAQRARPRCILEKHA